jgi:hypothetical protein
MALLLVRFQALYNLLVATEASCANATGSNGLEQSTTGFSLMPTVAESTVAKKSSELYKPLCDGVWFKMPESEFADTRRIDHFSTTR